MSRVGILTVHQSVNCGASLQAAALYRAVEDLGHSPQIINYCPRYFMSYMDESNRDARRTPKGRVKSLLIGKRLAKTANAFDEYADCFYPNKTKRLDTPDDLKTASLEYDFYLCGSDQIWNAGHVHFDSSWLFDFVRLDGSRKLVSYAASIGSDSPGAEEIDWIARGIGRFSSVGVREDSAIEVLESCGVSAYQCLDPTLLRTREEWAAQAIPADRVLPEKYIFYYPMEVNSLETELLGRMKKQLNLPCVALTDSFRRPPLADYQVAGFGPRQFLSLLGNAAAVFTNSFHGLAFSLIFQKPLVSYRHPTRNSRMESLLRAAGLSDFQFDSVDAISQWDIEAAREQISVASGRVSALKPKSLEFLKEALQ